MSQQIEELNLTIPDALEIIENQRILIENFSLLQNLVVTPAYIHADRHKDTFETLTTAWTYITGYDNKSANRKWIDLDLTSGAWNIDLKGVYQANIFVHVEGPASEVYEIGFLDSIDNPLSTYIFDAHDPGGHVYLHHECILEFNGPISGMHCAIRLLTGSSSVDVVHWHVSINRIDNYNIP